MSANPRRVPHLPLRGGGPDAAGHLPVLRRTSGLDVATLHEQLGSAYSSVAIRIAEVVRYPPLLVVLYEREERGHPAMT